MEKIDGTYERVFIWLRNKDMRERERENTFCFYM